MSRDIKMKNFIIIILVIVVFIFGKTIVRLENYHYASFVGMCDLHDMSGDWLLEKKINQDKCFKNVETRTSFMWHLYYALKDN
jgi:hypothetical protein